MSKKKAPPRRLDFEVDKLTNSIENTLTGESVETEVIRLGSEDATILSNLEWQFDWHKEFQKPRREVHALAAKKNPSVWHGLVSATDEPDHLFMHLIESAPFNKGHDKLFDGVMGNLVAFLCMNSFEKGHSGNVVFDSKTRLIEHYEKMLGAQHITHSRLFIGTQAASILVKQYFPNFEHDRNRL